MEKSRLFQLLSQLDKRDFRQMKKMVRSPFFNQRQDLVDLLAFVEDAIIHTKIVPTKEAVFAHLYPDSSSFDPQQVRLVMSLLYKLVEQYIALEEFTSDPLEVKLKLTTALRKRELMKPAQLSLKDANKRLEAYPYRNADFYVSKYYLEIEQFELHTLEKRNVKHDMQTISDAVDVSFLSNKLWQTCVAITHQNVSKIEYDFGMLPAVLAYLEERPQLLDIPAIGLYYYCYLALVHRDVEEYFHRFKALIFEYGEKFPDEEIHGLYLLAINYCIRRLNDGTESYAQEGLDLYRSGLRTGLLLKGGQLSRFTYRNIVAMGILSGELPWVEEFMHTYKSALDAKYRESTFNFNLAKLEYTRQRYDLALSLITKDVHKDLLLNLSAKALAMKIYYELDEYDTLDTHLQSMKAYLIRKKVLGYHRTNYSNLIKYTRKLTELNPFDRTAKAALRKAIEAEEPLLEKEWLLQQIDP